MHREAVKRRSTSVSAVLRSSDAKWLADLFDVGANPRLVGPVDRGVQGQVWRLETDEGWYAVKEALWPLDDHQALLANEFQARAMAHGVSAPPAVVARDGRVIIRDRGEPVRLFRWMRMDGPDRSIDPGDVGRMVAALHRAGGHVIGDIHPWYVEPVGIDGWHQLVAELRQADAPFSADLAGLVDALLEAELILTPPAGPLTVCHRDLWADNVRRVPGNGLAVIDWDNCGPESADQELSMLFVEFGGSRERVRTLYQAYCAAGGPGRVRSVSDFTMPVAVLGHIGEQACRQWLQAMTENDRMRAHRRIREFLGEPFTRDVIDQILSWLN